jgi:hypothetical protein
MRTQKIHNASVLFIRTVKNAVKISLFFVLILLCFLSKAQNLVTYAGGSGNESFNDVIQLSNGHILIIGVSDNLSWIPQNVPITQWANPGISNNQGTNRIPILIEFDSSLQNMLNVYHLPSNAAEDFRFIKTTNVPGQPTGDIYISGTTEDNTTGGYFIGRLDNNFINGNPTGFLWVENVKAKAGQNVKIYQPWDVGSDGKVVYAYGDSHDYNWSAIYRLKADGTDDVVSEWRVHWDLNNAEFYGNAASYPGGPSGLAHSAIVFKRDANRCELRSTNQADYDTWLPDGNGGMKKGMWPLDVLFDSPCSPGQPGNTTSGPGYTGYSPGATFTYGPSSICIDRRNNFMYIGFNAKSVLPSSLPDFEPAVMAMNNDGLLLWWSRIYHEVTPNGDTTNSTPDQYIDALAIDYSQPVSSGVLVVSARCHGNNVENLWEGNTIAANANASGFQNQFTGTNGNIHISWLGKLQTADGTLLNSTYVAEYNNTTTGLGGPHSDPNLDNWPDPNAGWPNVNTTYLGKNMLKVTADGSVIVLGKGRRTITTANAYQKMIRQTGSGNSCWNDFVRQYTPTLSKPLYSSILVGQWDTVTQTGGDNVRLYGMFKTEHGIIAVGKHTGVANDMPVSGVPSWGANTFNNESAVVAYLRASNIANIDDSPMIATTGIHQETKELHLHLFPNPADESFTIDLGETETTGTITITNQLGETVYTKTISQTKQVQVGTKNYATGVYFVQMQSETGFRTARLIIR